MGFFPNIFKKPSLGKIATAVVTGGISLLAPKLTAPIQQAVSKLYDPALIPLAISATTRVPLAASYGGAFSVGPQPFLGSIKLPTLQGVQPMALNVGGILGQVGTIFGGGQNQIFSGISNVANLASQFFPQPTAQTVLGMRPPMIPPRTPGLLGPMVRGLGRRFFEKFPNLALAMQQLRDRGLHVKRAQLWNLLKRFGPELLITGGILTAAAVSELMMAGPGHRRMNPGNAKALRRSLRRLESFHRLCQRADKFRRPRGSRKGCKTGSGQQFVRQG